MQAKQDDKSGIRIIPPAIFLIALAAAFLANWFWPVQFFPDVVRYSLGFFLLLASGAVMPFVLGAFKRADTTFDPRRQPSALVTEGAFRYSRNPSYMALIVLCIGIGVIADNAWVFITTAIATAYLYRFVILVEERILEAKFGEEYRQYKSRVRRWL